MTISKAYEEHMKKEHDGSKWGTTGWRYAGEQVRQALADRKYVRTVLDFGCGKGTLKPYLEQRLPTVSISEYDPGIPGKDVLSNDVYDAVVTTDVLEHVEPHLLDSTIQEIADRSKFVMIHDIPNDPTYKTFGEGPYKGQDLHLTVESPTWWRERFVEVLDPSVWQIAEFSHRERVSNKPPGKKTRTLLVIERVG